jgi:glyoxylase-like metal-dependent hydrolase (beta-lactamase superfamily II)
MGDDFVTYGLPFVDVASGGSVRGLIENLEKAMAAVPDEVKVIPGHGPVSAKADVKKFADILRDCVSLVEAALRQGRTLEQMTKENVLAKYDHLGQGFVKTASFVELIHNELRGQPGRTNQATRRHH